MTAAGLFQRHQNGSAVCQQVGLAAPAGTIYELTSQHGTGNKYNQGCRCDECKAGTARRKKELKEKRRQRLINGEVTVKHGTTGYGSWGCRCAVCTAAHVKACKPATERWLKRNPEKARIRTNKANRRWRKNNPERAKERQRIRYANAQGATIDKANRHNYPWTGPELETASRTDLTTREIALLLGRTYAAVNNMRHKLEHDPKTISRAGVAKGGKRVGGDR